MKDAAGEAREKPTETEKLSCGAEYLGQAEAFISRAQKQLKDLTEDIYDGGLDVEGKGSWEQQFSRDREDRRKNFYQVHQLITMKLFGSLLSGSNSDAMVALSTLHGLFQELERSMQDGEEEILIPASHQLMREGRRVKTYEAEAKAKVREREVELEKADESFSVLLRKLRGWRERELQPKQTAAEPAVDVAESVAPTAAEAASEDGAGLEETEAADKDAAKPEEPSAKVADQSKEIEELQKQLEEVTNRGIVLKECLESLQSKSEPTQRAADFMEAKKAELLETLRPKMEEEMKAKIAEIMQPIDTSELDELNEEMDGVLDRKNAAEAELARLKGQRQALGTELPSAEWRALQKGKLEAEVKQATLEKMEADRTYKTSYRTLQNAAETLLQIDKDKKEFFVQLVKHHPEVHEQVYESMIEAMEERETSGATAQERVRVFESLVAEIPEVEVRPPDLGPWEQLAGLLDQFRTADLGPAKPFKLRSAQELDDDPTMHEIRALLRAEQEKKELLASIRQMRTELGEQRSRTDAARFLRLEVESAFACWWEEYLQTLPDRIREEMVAKALGPDAGPLRRGSLVELG